MIILFLYQKEEKVFLQIYKFFAQIIDIFEDGSYPHDKKYIILDLSFNEETTKEEKEFVAKNLHLFINKYIKENHPEIIGSKEYGVLLYKDPFFTEDVFSLVDNKAFILTDDSFEHLEEAAYIFNSDYLY